jgi:hypothetical protein
VGEDRTRSDGPKKPATTRKMTSPNKPTVVRRIARDFLILVFLRTILANQARSRIVASRVEPFNEPKASVFRGVGWPISSDSALEPTALHFDKEAPKLRRAACRFGLCVPSWPSIMSPNRSCYYSWDEQLSPCTKCGSPPMSELAGIGQSLWEFILTSGACACQPVLKFDLGR